MRTPLRYATRVLLAAVAVGALSTIAVGCGGSDDKGGESGGGEDTFGEAVALMDEGKPVDETGSATVAVKAIDNNFKPKYIEVSKGTTVDFTNDGRNVHNVLPVEDGAFTPIQADAFDAGDEGTVTFDEVGDFPYYCSLHGTATKGMIGGVRVVE